MAAKALKKNPHLPRSKGPGQLKYSYLKSVAIKDFTML